MRKFNSLLLAIAMSFYGITAIAPALALANNGNGNGNEGKDNHGSVVRSTAKDNHGAEVKSNKNNNDDDKNYNHDYGTGANSRWWSSFWSYWNNWRNNHKYNNGDHRSIIAPPFMANVTTNSATGITSTSATVNGKVGPSDATDTSFWLGTTSAGPFASSTDPSGQLPIGWAGIDSLAKTARSQFSHAYTGLTPDTTYYFVAWALVNGTWYPGSVLNFTTASAPSADTTLPNILFATNIGSAASTTSLIWVTDEASDSNIWIDTVSPVSTTTAPAATSGTLSYFHQLFLPADLATSTLYYYTISSADSSGNTAYYSSSFTSPSI